MNSLSPRGKWIINNVNKGVIIDVGFAGSNDSPDVLFQHLRQVFGERKVIGVDINTKKVRAMGKKNTVVADGRRLPFKDGAADTVLLAEVIEHHTEVLSFFKEAYRVLRQNGVFLLTTPNPYGIFRYLKHFLLAADIASRKNVKDYLGFYDHQTFYEPLSIANLLYIAGFRQVEYLSTNPAFPYLPGRLREPNFSFWPFDRLGTYSCFKAHK